MQKKKGVSLIVLVITIIVMVILAGAIVLTLNNSGIINKANEAVEVTNEAQVKQIAQVGWASAYVDGARTEEELRTGVISALEQDNIKPEDYLINVTTNGVFVKLLKNAWIQEGFTVVKGDQVLEIGDSIAYDETVGGTKLGLAATDWKILGADEEGNLLIMSTTEINALRLGVDSTLTTAEEKRADCQNDWLNGATQLDTICEPYGDGEGVVGKARSITVEDVNNVTGYDPETALYGKDQLYQYGNEVTYSYNGTANPTYTSVVVSGTLYYPCTNGFYCYNGKESVHITDVTTGTSGEVFAKIKNDFYTYYAPDLTTISKTDNTKAYSMIFGSSLYWLASPCVYTDTYYANYGMRIVGGENVTGLSFFTSTGSCDSYEFGVRAVVTLSSDIVLKGDSTNGWSY